MKAKLEVTFYQQKIEEDKALQESRSDRESVMSGLTNSSSGLGIIVREREYSNQTEENGTSTLSEEKSVNRGKRFKSSAIAKSISSLNLLTWTSITGMDDSFSVIKIIEEDDSEELIEAAKLVEIFEYNSLPDNMEATKVVEETETESKSPRFSETSEGTEDTET